MLQQQPMELTVPQSGAGQRLDRFVAAEMGLSRSQVAARVAAAGVLVDAVPATKAGLKLRAGQHIHVELAAAPSTDALPQDIPLSIVYEDEHIVVVDKASDMVVHPSPGHDDGTLVNALLFRYDVLGPDPKTEDGRPRPGIVHRLDRGTSGLLIVARTAQAMAPLQKMIAAREVQRRYLAIVHGPNLPDEGTFDTLHGRHPRDRKRFSSLVNKGRHAVSHYTVLARARCVALVECRLETGRTHQIRVHFADAGHPLVGDTVYGGRRRAPGSEGKALARIHRQALHAWRLAFRHPVLGEPLQLCAPPPEDLRLAIAAVFKDFELS